MILKVFGETYNCVSVTRTGKDSLECRYVPESGGEDIMKFGGISDMTVYKFTDDNGEEYSAADLAIVVTDDITALELALVEQFEENLAIKEELTNTQMALTEMYELIIGGVKIG